MKVLMFQNGFAEAIKSGEKGQTIRPRRKRVKIQIGDPVSLRKWSGPPYQSKQETLRESEITDVSEITISKSGVKILGCPIPDGGLDDFARADGFDDWASMIDWFQANYGPHFEGDLITWRTK